MIHLLIAILDLTFLTWSFKSMQYAIYLNVNMRNNMISKSKYKCLFSQNMIIVCQTSNLWVVQLLQANLMIVEEILGVLYWIRPFSI